jgi:hypothetical protein
MIRESTDPNQWFHISGKDNPADFLTKQQDLSSLDWDKWLYGPAFLKTHKSNWDVHKDDFELLSSDPEVKNEVCANVAQVHPKSDVVDKLFEHYSSWFKLKRGIAWLLRFKKFLCGQKAFEKTLTLAEVNEAEVSALKYVQSVVYHKECVSLKNSQTVNKDSTIRSLSPVLGDDGLLRVGGRLRLARGHDLCVHPVIVPHSHPISGCIVNDSHSVAHLGTEWTVSVIRKKYWITKIRTLVKSVSRKCFMCKKLFAPLSSQRMSDLPFERLEPYKRPFSYTGIDCFGPFIVKQRRSEIKRYGCIFTCLSIRAVHIEMLSRLDTDSFICALRRFVARRGCPQKIFCDNGTNFVGAHREIQKSLNELDQDKLQLECVKSDIQWHFNPPTASHMGGIWERLIRVIRKVFAGILIESCRMTDEMLQTVFAEVESIINGRPITKVSDDPKDESALTPNHLLLIGHGHSYSPGVFCDKDIYKRSWRFVQHLVDQFWKQWLRSYIPELQRRSKWLKNQRNFCIGDLVLIADQNTPRNIWPMAIVTGVNQSSDGLIRTVKVKTKSAELIRPVHKLVFLECAA